MSYEFIGYAELGEKDFPKITDCLFDDAYKGKDKIVDYLKNREINTVLCVSPSIPKDVFTGESIKMEDICMTDGIYAWDIVLSYYVERYNLRLPHNFENHILNS